MNNFKFYSGKNLFMRGLEPEDIDNLSFIYQQDVLTSNLLASNKLPSYTQKEKNSLRLLLDQKDSFMFLFFKHASNDFVGCSSINQVNWIDRKACYGLHIVPDHQKQHFGSEATFLVFCYAFLELNLNRIELFALEKNLISIKMCQNLGAKIEGTKRQAQFFDGNFHDQAIMSVLKQDFQEIYESASRKYL